MTKRKIIRKSNRPFSINSPRYYSWGGDFMSTLGSSFNGANAAKMLQGGIVGIGARLLGGAVNSLFGSSLNQGNINAIEDSISSLQNLKLSGNNSDILNKWGNQSLGISFDKSDIGKEGLFSNAVTNKYNQLKEEQSDAIKSALNAYSNSFNNNNENAFLSSLARVNANGGPLIMRYSGLMSPFGNRYSNGGKIHIKKANRGKFTEYCGGKVTSECIAKGKRSSDPTVRKRATFAANARKWKHAFGGNLLTHGAEWDNGLRIIGNGGTHEENPMEGVPMGMDQNGTPNLVEQGEVIFNDYVFSNRMFADGGLLESFNLPKSYDGYSFAAIAERLGEESKERPNDPISKRGLLSSMSRLQQAQESIRQQNQAGQEGVQYAHGGKMGMLFDGLGDAPNFLDGVDYGDWQDYGTLLEPVNAEDLWDEAMAGSDGAEDGDNTNNKSKLTWLRYAPVAGAAIGLGQNLFSRPDYTSADTILEAANQAGNYTPVSYTPIGNYLQYRPFDRNFYINKLNAQAGATRRAIMNTTSPLRGAALLAADYNAQGRLGDLARQAEEYNLAQRQAVETFNRGTNMSNAEMGLKAAMANQEAALKARSSRLSGVAQAMAVRDAVDARRGASMSANLTNFFNSLGDIGREEYSRNMIMSNPALYYSIDSKGNVSYKNGYENLSEAEKKEVRDAANKAKKKRAKGGYLTIKKK